MTERSDEPPGRPYGRALRRRGWNRRVLLAAGLVGLACQPSSWSDDAFVLTGEFTADGGCTVRLDGQPVEGMEGARSLLTNRPSTSDTLGRYTLHGVVCNGPAPTAPPLDRRSFWGWGPVAMGTPLRPGRHRITGDAITTADTTAWEANLWHPRFDGDRAFLVGYEGSIDLVQVDSPTVVGTFRVVARRKRKNPF